jgi:quercetin dioxygenase-like cupin family protein
MQPGAETGWHEHDVPLFGYMLEGELTVDYGTKGTRVYRKGDSLVEAIDVAHNGRNTGSGVARILAVFIGAEGVPDTVKVEPPR